MLLYLSEHTSTYIAIAMNIFVWYMFSPKQYFKLELKRLAHYMKQTKDHGLVLNPNFDMCKVNAYPDAIFMVIMNMKSLLILNVII